MAIRIIDTRSTVGLPIKDMPDGTWFVTNLGLFLKAAHDVCVDVKTGLRSPFNEDLEGQPVDIEMQIVRNAYR